MVGARRSPFVLALKRSAVAVVAITALAGSSASASAGAPAAHTARPVVGGSLSGAGGPRSVDGKKRLNVNVTNYPAAQSETTVAVNPTDPLDLLAASNELGGPMTARVHESIDGGKHWSLVTTGITGFCYDPWLHFDDLGDAFFAYECNPAQSYAYRLHGTSTWVLTTFSFGLTGTVPDRDMIITDDTPSSPFHHSAYIGYGSWAWTCSPAKTVRDGPSSSEVWWPEACRAFDW
jgi:hypothetical protein